MPGLEFRNSRRRPSCACLRRTLDVVLPLIIVTLICAISIHKPTPEQKQVWSIRKSAATTQKLGNFGLSNLNWTHGDAGQLPRLNIDRDDVEGDKAQISESTLVLKGERSIKTKLDFENVSVSDDDPLLRVYGGTNLLKNITKMGSDNKLFIQIPDEGYLKENKSYFEFQPSAHRENNSFSFLITGKSVCLEAPFVLVVIPSVVDHRDMREAIRRTWVKAAETNSWPKAKVSARVKHIFLFGYEKNSKSQDFRRLLQESDEHRDVVMVDFEDSYRNLTLKILSGFLWKTLFCPDAEILLKVDEDTFINAPLMTELLLRVHREQKSGKYVLGLKHSYRHPEVARTGKWAVSKEEYPLDYYPQYLYGHAYAISRLGVGELLEKSAYARIIAPEDAYITGVLPKVSGIPRLDAPSFTVCCRLIYDCEVVWNRRVALTAVANTKTLNQLWSNVLADVCDNDVAFIDDRPQRR